MAMVFLVEDVGNSPGKIYAVFAEEDDADIFAEDMEADDWVVRVVPRTLYYGQPPFQGFNR